ncbi:MAG: zf-HC2 domain-containing protein, partial [Planctomycetes bacterium]|nr:zf-HC2 domain-containing protein [Planctomycetota bacterium]
MGGGEKRGCEQVERILSRLIFGELEEVEKASILEHLAGCPTCAERLRELEETTRLLEEGLSREAAPRLSDAQREELRAILEAILKGGKKAKWRVPVEQLAMAAVVLVVLGIGMAGMLMPAFDGGREMALAAIAKQREEMEEISGGSMQAPQQYGQGRGRELRDKEIAFPVLIKKAKRSEAKKENSAPPAEYGRREDLLAYSPPSSSGSSIALGAVGVAESIGGGSGGGGALPRAYAGR